MTTFAEPGHIAKPEGGEAADGPAQIGAVADRLAALFTGVTTAQRDALAGDDLWTGRRIYNTTTARTEEYTGSAWRAVGSADLATHASASDPHTGYVRKATATAKGDLYVATASGVITRKAVGANGRALVADDTQPDGLAWTDQFLKKQDLLFRGYVVDLPSIPANTTSNVAIPTTAGHIPNVNYRPVYIDGLSDHGLVVVGCRVTAVDEITMTMSNLTAAAINPPTRTIRFLVRSDA